MQAMLQQSLLNITVDSLEPTAATASEANATGSPQFPSTASEAVDQVPLEDHITAGSAARLQSPNSTARLEEPTQITSDTPVTAATEQHLSSQAQQFAAPGNLEQQGASRHSPGAPSSCTMLRILWANVTEICWHVVYLPVRLCCTSRSQPMVLVWHECQSQCVAIWVRSLSSCFA